MTDQTSLAEPPHPRLPTLLHPGHLGSWGPCQPLQEWCLMFWSQRNRVWEESSLIEELGRAGLVYEQSQGAQGGRTPPVRGRGTQQLTCTWWPPLWFSQEPVSSILLPSAIAPLLSGISQCLLVSWVWWQWRHPPRSMSNSLHHLCCD